MHMSLKLSCCEAVRHLSALDVLIDKSNCASCRGHVLRCVGKIGQRCCVVGTIEWEAHGTTIRIQLVLETTERGSIVAWEVPIYQTHIIFTYYFHIN